MCIRDRAKRSNRVTISRVEQRDIRLDESGFGFGEYIRDGRVYTRIHDKLSCRPTG